MIDAAEILRALEVVRTHDDTMPIQRLATFLCTAARGQVSREDVAESLGQSPAAAYRNLVALSDEPYMINLKKMSGLGWLTHTYDPDAPRRKLWQLTPNGSRVLKQMEDIINGERAA